MRRLEEERLADAQTAQVQHDETFLRLAHADGERLLHGARLLGQAALLLLKKIALVQEGLIRLVEDQELQQRLLADLVGRLKLHRRAYERRQRIDRVLREVADMAEVALDFETYMRAHLGPLQAMLDHVVQLDSGLHRTVTEIETLTQQMLRQGAVALPGSEALDSRWLDFLTTSQVKKERLHDVWERLERQDGTLEGLEADIATSAAAPSVLMALNNIEGLVEVRLGAFPSEEPTTLMPSSQEHSLVSSIGMAFVWIPAGEFQMGSDEGQGDEKPVHTVHISRPFALGQYLVTQAQWEAVMGSNPSRFPGDPSRPVENVSWDEVQQFIQKLQAREPEVVYRLPTEAEWEYAARAGSIGAYCFGDNAAQLQRYAWYHVNAGGSTHPVGQLLANAWGLHDMHGNVWEWVQDWYGSYAAAAAVDPIGPAAAGSVRLMRGGGWSGGASNCRAAHRSGADPGLRSGRLGFRLLREVS
jgi:formylglycine-generating enzyme required for sulfatase activity